jgi:hypothetical protein
VPKKLELTLQIIKIEEIPQNPDKKESQASSKIKFK